MKNQDGKNGESGPAIISWEGDSKEVLTDFPEEVKKTLGFSLRQIQNGNRPRCECRSMDVVGLGVW
jgi:phage-related protein